MSNVGTKPPTNTDREIGISGIDTLPSGGLVSAPIGGKQLLEFDWPELAEFHRMTSTEGPGSVAYRIIVEASPVASSVKAANSQSTPAKPSERISGSETNASGSAGSKTSASKITLTPELITALKKKVADHNEAMRSRSAGSHRMATLPMLKAVLRRGMGAYSVSHRPNVSSRQQWGMARVNAFLKLLASGKPTDSKYVSDNDLLPKGHERATRKS